MDASSIPAKTGHSAQVTRSDMDFSALLESLRSTPGGEGATVAEICKQTGKSKQSVRDLLRLAIDSGKVRVAKKMVKDIGDRLTFVPSYVICEPETIVREQVRL